jgi:hypothetical protein
MTSRAGTVRNIIRWYTVYLGRRGAKPLAQTTGKEVTASINTGRLFIASRLNTPADAGAVVGGTRVFDRNIVAIIVPSSNTAVFSESAKFAELLNSAAAEAKRAGFGKDFNVHIIGEPASLRSQLAKPVAVFGDRTGSSIEYFAFQRFVTDIQQHAHARTLRHKIMTGDEINLVCGFYRMDPAMLSVLPSWDPQCIWIGAHHGDIVRVEEVTGSGTDSENYFRVVSLRLKK